ncbi:sperm-associated antigen 16 protein [Parambassis ranga]|uniref:Sperm-associated antigen 16 protein n=1 Tax=Parambassis ranga TaxID=210632 RepID=A0A6P7JC32_9TELE|nr:sperm-associated antigen 16 protein [Parambassis ranga]
MSKQEALCRAEKMSATEDRKEKERSAEEEDIEEVMREAASSTTTRPKPGLKQPIIINIPEPVEDFLRNFLRRAGLSRTLNSFEAESYSSAHQHLPEALTTETPDVFFMPDALTHRYLLQSKLDTVNRQRDLLRQQVLEAAESLVRMQRERDFHRLQYQRVAEEKNSLIKRFKQLKEHLQSYQPVLSELDHKYQAALRKKQLISLEKERVQTLTEKRLNQEPAQGKKERGNTTDKSSAKSTTRHSKDSEFPLCSRPVNPQLDQATPETEKDIRSFSLSWSFRAHKLPVSCIDLHPQKLILASTSDDLSWRLWALPTSGEKVGQMVFSGVGHSDWLSGCSFHPDGSKLATTSGDTTVRLWDFSRSRCVLMLSGHTQPTWRCSFHSCGHFLASCSADRTAKLWDLNSQRCHLTLHHHTASVNSVCFLPYSNLLLTCSADKTLALWDARLAICTITFGGHQHPCNHATYSPVADAVASCDSSGAVKLWDMRKPATPTAAVDAGPLGANQVVFSPSGKTLAVASSDSLVRLVEVDSCAMSSLSGHSNGVQSMTFDHKGKTVMSAGSDGLICIWS